jgi:oligopeptide transport system substrate-binding protein
MLTKRPAALVAAALAGAMLLSACGGGDDGGSDASGGTYSVYINEPQSPLVPGDTTEDQGNQVIHSLWTGLVEYDQDGAIQYTGVADSIETQDNVTWTVKLKDGWTFHDGTPVDAASFVDAWNYTAYSPNAFTGSSFFANIEGYDDLQAPTDAEGNVTGDPAASEMSGLQVVDDTTFTVTLTGPFAQFPVTVGYTVFYPLPDVFFDDPEAFGTNPVGNGPFQAEEEYQAGVGFTLTRYDDYAGENAAQAEALEYRVYADVNTAYTDVQGGSVDIVRRIPADAATTAPAEFGDRYLETEGASFDFLRLPLYDERYSDPRVRQALSLAVDRAAISEAIFGGTREPADAFIPPTIPGYREGACTYCELDVDRANQLLDDAGFDRSQPIELWFNAGGGHEAWMQAVGNQLRDNLGVQYILKGDLQQAQYLPLATNRGMTGPFRQGWGMDYPSPQNFLEPLHSTAAFPPGSNYSFYSNPEFDDLVVQGNEAAGQDEAIEYYNQAEDVLAEDMPLIPMFFRVEQTVFSENVSNVDVDIFGRIDTAAVTVN